ncbi:hypothetical protein Q3F51_12135 [Enterococcus faecium]|nr:hypothetical protein [Enterococcus faecium]MDP8584630.1 hypothetical protein [Listeria innocua]MDQ8554249.1 hypothetical protein [Enterococcus faecium]
MEKEKKDYQRSIRMTQTTKNILLATEGNGLNKKLENLVYQAHIKEKELDERLQQKEQYLEQLQQQIKEKNLLLQKLNEAEYHIKSLLNI